MRSRSKLQSRNSCRSYTLRLVLREHHPVMKHFSGNFWWTTAAYYRTLPDDIAADDYIGARPQAALPASAWPLVGWLEPAAAACAAVVLLRPHHHKLHLPNS